MIAAESFLASVDAGAQTGGDIFNDIITLKNGIIIRISSDVICVYGDADKDSDGLPIACIEMKVD